MRAAVAFPAAAAAQFPDAASAPIVNSGAEDSSDQTTGWTGDGWGVASYGQSDNPVVADASAGLGARVFSTSQDGATLTQTVPFDTSMLGKGYLFAFEGALGATAGDDAFADITAVALDAQGNELSRSVTDRGPSISDRTYYGQMQQCIAYVPALSNIGSDQPSPDVRSIRLTVTAHVPFGGDRVFFDAARAGQVGVPLASLALPPAGYPAKQSRCSTIRSYFLDAASKLPQPAPQLPSNVDPLPVRTAPLPMATLKAALGLRLGALRFVTGVNTAGTYRIKARLGAVTVTRSVVVSKAGLVTFKLTPTAAQTRRLRRALHSGRVTVK